MSGMHESPSVYPGGVTGRYLVSFHEEAAQEATSVLERSLGVSTTTATADTLTLADVETQAVVFENLGVAVLEEAPLKEEEVGVAGAGALEAIAAIEPERIVYALEKPPGPETLLGHDQPGPRESALSHEYLRGFRDAADRLASGAGAGLATQTGLAGAPAITESQATWGLQAIRADRSVMTGENVRVAVLDTGVDQDHPDFQGRDLDVESFVQGEDPQDGHGHGTHCIGTACGSKSPTTGPRYGVAFGAPIFAGKVLRNTGRGIDEYILAGINAAMNKGCDVVSMSLGAPTVPGQAFSTAFELAAQRALKRGTLIVAAAGNDSRRNQGVAQPVSHPANCPSILAVAAVDSALRVAPFSNQGTDVRGGQIDIAGPGVDVYSCFPMPTGYRRWSGTSMATPHIAGVAALLKQANPGATATEISAILARHAQRLSAPGIDVGAGLVQAP